jgi:hypothetical protein
MIAPGPHASVLVYESRTVNARLDCVPQTRDASTLDMDQPPHYHRQREDVIIASRAKSRQMPRVREITGELFSCMSYHSRGDNPRAPKPRQCIMDRRNGRLRNEKLELPCSTEHLRLCQVASMLTWLCTACGCSGQTSEDARLCRSAPKIGPTL